MKALQDVSYERPSPIRAATIPHLMAGHDLLGQAQTGTGKTAAFALPLLSRLEAGNRNTRILVLAPTRELACRWRGVPTLCQHMPDSTCCPSTAALPTKQTRALRPRCLRLSWYPRPRDGPDPSPEPGPLGLKALVLDEAGRNAAHGLHRRRGLDHGSVPGRSSGCPVLCHHAGADPSCCPEAPGSSPKEIKIASKTATATTIRQRYWQVTGLHKLDAMTRLLEVGIRTKPYWCSCAPRTPPKSWQASWLPVVTPVKPCTVTSRRSCVSVPSTSCVRGQLDILIATDVVARGLDVERITHVVNYDIPTTPNPMFTVSAVPAVPVLG